MSKQIFVGENWNQNDTLQQKELCINLAAKFTSESDYARKR